MPANSLVSRSTLEDLAVVLAGRAAAKPADVGLETVSALGLKQLQEAARTLGLTGISRLKKDALVQAVWESWQAGLIAGGVAAAPAPKSNGATAGAHAASSAAPARDGDTNPVAPVAHKYELQQLGPAAAVPPVGEIPWGYGSDRVTAMPVDPDRVFVYWEVLEDSIARARAALGPRGEGAWLNLRLYDVTGRIFDGGNAHGFFDQGLDRNARQWFFTVGKPTSEMVVEIGMRAADGAFEKIARSGRVEFPRRDPVAWAEPEWLTVRATGAEVIRAWMPPSAHPSTGTGTAAADAAGHSGGDAPAADVAGDAPETVADGGPSLAWDVGVQLEGAARVLERTEWEEVHSDGSAEIHRRITWEEQSTITSWQEGPFSYPVEVPPPVFESFVGRTRVYRAGPRTRVVYGPWQVVIRGVGATSASQVISRWEVYRSWAEERGTELTGFTERTESDERVVAGGGSERRLVGASERHWRGASELRLGGSSEIYFVGASERRLMGASELAYVGASERVRRGASERRLGGASEWRVGGASEKRLGGGSEERFSGGSEGRLGGGGGSEHRFIGASENLAQRRAVSSDYPRLDAAAAGGGGRTRGE